MKSLFVLMAFAIFSATCMNAEDLKLRVDRNSPGHVNRVPAFIPNAAIEGNTLTFDASCIGCPLALMQDDAVVYATVISENAEGNGGEVVLPDYLAGQYEIQI